MRPRRGLTFTSQRKSPSGKPHLWVVLSEPHGIPPSLLVVSLTSYQQGMSRACIFNQGEHRFIRHETVVYYRGLGWLEAGELQTMFSDASAIHDQDATPDLMLKIVDACLMEVSEPDGKIGVGYESYLVEQRNALLVIQAEASDQL